MKTIEQVIAYCKKQAAEYQEAWDTAPDHNESTEWYLEPVADAYRDVIDYINGIVDEDGDCVPEGER